jgi:hypothetical protein
MPFYLETTKFGPNTRLAASVAYQHSYINIYIFIGIRIHRRREGPDICQAMQIGPFMANSRTIHAASEIGNELSAFKKLSRG